MSYKIYGGSQRIDLETEWWVALSNKLAMLPGILQTRTHHEVLVERYRQGRSAIACTEDAIIGHAAVWFPRPHLCEVSTVWVDTDHRGRGLTDRLVERCIRDLPPPVTTLFMVVHELPMSRAASRLHWHSVSSKAWTRQVPEISTCGSCRRQIEELRPNCPMRAVPGQCQIFIKRR